MTAEQLIAKLEQLPNHEILIKTQFNYNKISHIEIESALGVNNIIINTKRLWENDNDTQA